MLIRERPVVVIAGPTASGKSALALAIAERDGGVVINADASQVYGCWRVLTARPGEDALVRAPHRLYGHVGCDADYSVGQWLRDVAGAIGEARAAGLRPVVVGGTGLYLRALTLGLARVPKIPPEIRRRSEEMLASGGLGRMLAELDAETAGRIDGRNPMRVQRAWEVLVATGRGLAAWQAENEPAVVPLETAERMVVDVGKERLNSNIERRFQAMLEEGVVDEVRAFRHWDRMSAQAIGAREILGYLEGRSSLDEAVAQAVAATRRFGKRQRTWFRNQAGDWPRVDAAGRPVPGNG